MKKAFVAIGVLMVFVGGVFFVTKEKPLEEAVSTTMTVKAYFPNTKKDGMECEATYPAIRTIGKTVAPGRAALEELLKGPTITEREAGFITSIPDGAKINSLTITDGLAKVDFDETLDKGVAGSCRVASIHSQIKETLLQFPTITSVQVSINGRVDDILQP